MVLNTTLLNTQHYKVRIKSKVEQSKEWSSALPYTPVWQPLKREPLGHSRLRSPSLHLSCVRNIRTNISPDKKNKLSVAAAYMFKAQIYSSLYMVTLSHKSYYTHKINQLRLIQHKQPHEYIISFFPFLQRKYWQLFTIWQILSFPIKKTS